MNHVLKQYGFEGVHSLKTYWDLRISNVALTLEQEDQELLQVESQNILVMQNQIFSIWQNIDHEKANLLVG